MKKQKKLHYSSNLICMIRMIRGCSFIIATTRRELRFFLRLQQKKNQNNFVIKFCTATKRPVELFKKKKRHLELVLDLLLVSAIRISQSLDESGVADPQLHPLVGRGNLIGRQVNHGDQIPGRGGDHRPEDVAENIRHDDPPRLAGNEVERAGEEQERHGLAVLPEGGGLGVEIGALRRPEEGDAVADGEVGRCGGGGEGRGRGRSGGGRVVRRAVGGLGLLLGAGVGAGGGHEDVVDGAGGHGGGGGGEEGEGRADRGEEGAK